MAVIIYFIILFFVNYILRRPYLNLPPDGDAGSFLYYSYFKGRESKEDSAKYFNTVRASMGAHLLYHVIFTLSGRRFKVIRIFSLIYNFVTPITMYYIIVTFADDNLAGILAATFYILYLSHPALEPWAETKERYQSPLIILSYLLVLLDFNESTFYLPLLAGISLGVSSVVKITSSMNLPVMVFLYMVFNFSLTPILAIVLGFTFPWVMIRLFAPGGDVDSILISWWKVFLFKIRQNFGKKDLLHGTAIDNQSVPWLKINSAELFRAGSAIWIFALVYLVKEITNHSILNIMLLLWLLVGLVIVFIEKGRFPQYFYQLILAACMMAGIAVSGIWNQIVHAGNLITFSQDPTVISLFVFIVISIFVTIKLALDSPLRPSKFTSLPNISFYRKLVLYIRENSNEQDYIFQWGNSAHLHVRSGRPAISGYALYPEVWSVRKKNWIKELIGSFLRKKPALAIMITDGAKKFPIRLINTFSGLIYQPYTVKLGEFKVLIYKLANVTPFNKMILHQGGDPVDNSIEAVLHGIQDGRVPSDQIKQVLSDISIINPLNQEIEVMLSSLAIREGEALFAKGKLNEAEKVFLKLLDKAHPNKEVLNNLGAIAFQTNKFEQSIQYFIRSLDLDAHYKEAFFNLSYVFREMSRFSDLLPFAEEIIKAYPEDEKIYQIVEEVRSAA